MSCRVRSESYGCNATCTVSVLIGGVVCVYVCVLCLIYFVVCVMELPRDAE